LIEISRMNRGLNNVFLSLFHMQGEPGVDYNEPNLNPLTCDICNQKFDSLDKLGDHQKKAHDM
jgi:hypothetical protein